MKRYIVILSLLSLFLPQSVHSQLISHHGVVKGAYDFWVYKPQELAKDSDARLPLVLFLHGKSLSGNNLERVRDYGPLEALKFGRKIDALVLAPQARGGCSPSKVMKVLDWTEKHYPVDTNRIYVFGMSMGGYGTIDFVGTYPDKVAAAIAMCGGGTIKDYSGLNRVPLWIIHGTSDSAVSHKESEKVVAAMKASGPTDLLRFDLIKGASHSRLGRVFYMSEPYEWFSRHSLADSVRTLDTTVQITDAGMSDAYKSLPGRRTLKVIEYKQPAGRQTAKASETRSEVSKTSESADVVEVAGGQTERVYIVKAGDTLSKIAKMNGTTVDSLCEKNNITRRTILHIGRRLVL